MLSVAPHTLLYVGGTMNHQVLPLGREGQDRGMVGARRREDGAGQVYAERVREHERRYVCGSTVALGFGGCGVSTEMANTAMERVVQ